MIKLLANHNFKKKLLSLSAFRMSLVYDKAADFKHILRILNTNIEGKQKLPFGLRNIKGVGRRFAFMICKVLRLSPS